VLREYTNGVPPNNLLSAIPEQVIAFLQGAAGAFTWAWQELDKGRCLGNGFLSSNHGGWGFNSYYDTNYFYNDGYVTNHMSADQAAALSTQELQTNAFFNTNTPDTALFGSGGSQYAQVTRNRILSDAIPALTLPVGANPTTILDQPGNPHNFNMKALYENGWPTDRMQKTEANNWHHSDVEVVAYTFTYPLFNKLVTTGNLK
jgi:hypothetical protein